MKAESIPVGGKRKFIARRLKCEKLARCPDTQAHTDEVSTHATQAHTPAHTPAHTRAHTHSHTQSASKQSVGCKATLITFSVNADAAGPHGLALGLGGVCAIFDLHSICNNFRLTCPATLMEFRTHVHSRTHSFTRTHTHTHSHGDHLFGSLIEFYVNYIIKFDIYHMQKSLLLLHNLQFYFQHLWHKKNALRTDCSSVWLSVCLSSC